MPSIQLPPERRSIVDVRRFIVDVAPAAIDTAPLLLMATELVANVVKHARTDAVVSVHVGTRVRVEVHDGVAATPAFRALIDTPPALVPATAETGRGLHIVHAFATNVGLDDDHAGGKIVWFEL